MKIQILFLLLLISVMGCKNKEEVAYVPLNYESDPCIDCATVAIAIFEFNKETDLGIAVNTALRKEIVRQLNFEGNAENASIEEAIAAFKKEFQDLRDMYPEESIDWEAIIKSEITYENKDVLTIQLDTYIFTGGAHGHSTLRFLNFNKKKNELFENWELFKEIDDFEHFAETKFKIQEDIPQNSEINSTGFMFEGERFYLPNNLGFTKKGVQLIYNQYEIASYADGPIFMTLPYTEIESFLSVKILPKSL
ncbi:DUF3298 and DUF4163 domain-containing protein [Cellulophaga sp. Hel_I_12]|uniref:DUF3298 and DUF4163 domain-containing protein n=1 Tax=Cellulophaga sp. Hel_I_12 TaxID=1249972 RepID=UPI000647A82C|nr:DUF3298 and DUF4163 domain-containing protein [Cellulophaga sp. Hel_I_12]